VRASSACRITTILGVSGRGARDAPAVRKEGIGVIHWSPLARCFLPAIATRRNLARIRSPDDDYAREYYQPSDFACGPGTTFRPAAGIPNAHVSLAWVLQQPGVTAPIVGRQQMKLLDYALAALEVNWTPRI